MLAPIVGHVGDGNFHLLMLIDPTRPEELATAEKLNKRLVRRAIAMGGTCTGEHGVGYGKIDSLAEEAGPAVEVMAAIKRALDPREHHESGQDRPDLSTHQSGSARIASCSRAWRRASTSRSSA